MAGRERTTALQHDDEAFARSARMRARAKQDVRRERGYTKRAVPQLRSLVERVGKKVRVKSERRKDVQENRR
jgi:hypothetical protein